MFKLEYMVVGNVNFSELTFFLVETMFWSNWIQLLNVDILDDDIAYALFLVASNRRSASYVYSLTSTYLRPEIVNVRTLYL